MWLFCLVVIGLCAIFGTVVSALGSRLDQFKKISEHDIKVLQTQVKSLKKAVMRHHPDYDPDE